MGKAGEKRSQKLQLLAGQRPLRVGEQEFSQAIHVPSWPAVRSAMHEAVAVGYVEVDECPAQRQALQVSRLANVLLGRGEQVKIRGRAEGHRGFRCGMLNGHFLGVEVKSRSM